MSIPRSHFVVNPEPECAASAHLRRVTSILRYKRHMQTAALDRLRDLIWEQAKPVDKFGHQPRLQALVEAVGAGLDYDDDVVLAAAWLHDLGVFVGNRPENPEDLASWDHVAYACRHAPEILREAGFPQDKIPAVLQVIREHQPKDEPTTTEAIILRDADILEQLGAIGILRTVSKVGRDTRFPRFSDAVAALRRNLEHLPGYIRLHTTRRLAEPRILILQAFITAVEDEAGPNLF